jgi:hypothetical protein
MPFRMSFPTASTARDISGSRLALATGRHPKHLGLKSPLGLVDKDSTGATTGLPN